MKTVLIIVFNDANRDPRVLKQINALKDQYKLVVAHHGSALPFQNITFITIPERTHFFWKTMKKLALLFKAYSFYFWIARLKKEVWLDQLKTLAFDCIIANDAETLPLASICTTKKIHLDEHEYSPDTFSDKWIWKKLYQPYQYYLCKTYYPICTSFSTVCQSIADLYHKNFNIPSAVHVFPNVAKYHNCQPKPTKTPIKLIHHGSAIPSRHIEDMIDLMPLLGENYTLDLMLLNVNNSYCTHLQNHCKKVTNAQIIPAVPFQDIIPTLENYDIGLFHIPPVNTNYKYCLPNKLFEYIQARLAIAISPSIEMKRLVQDYDIGMVSPTFSINDLANTILSTSPEQINQYKKNADSYAKSLSEDVIFKHFAEVILPSCAAS